MSRSLQICSGACPSRSKRLRTSRSRWGRALENSHADFGVLVLDGLAFGVGRAIGQGESGIDGHLAAARIHDAADETRGLAADDRAHLSHQSLGLTQFAALDGLDDHKEDIADAVVEILEAELAPEKEAHTLGEEPVGFLDGGGLVVADFLLQRVLDWPRTQLWRLQRHGISSRRRNSPWIAAGRKWRLKGLEPKSRCANGTRSRGAIWGRWTFSGFA